VRALAGVNAAVVGLLAAALVNPVCSSALFGLGDAVIALVGVGLLVRRTPTLAVIVWCLIAAACTALV
jgi:chromate transporter